MKCIKSTLPVAEGCKAHGGRHKRNSPEKCCFTTQEQGKHTGHTHGEKLDMKVYTNTLIKLLSIQKV